MITKRRKIQHIGNGFDAPIVEVFGSALALLIIILVISNIVITQDIRAMLDRSTEGAKFDVSWQDGSQGFVIITYANKLRIIESNQALNQNEICKSNSPFLQYAEKIYDNNDKQQLIFAITEKGVTTMAIARECLRTHYPKRRISIGWIIANKDLLSTVRLQNLPSYIKKTIKPQ